MAFITMYAKITRLAKQTERRSIKAWAVQNKPNCMVLSNDPGLSWTCDLLRVWYRRYLLKWAVQVLENEPTVRQWPTQRKSKMRCKMHFIAISVIWHLTWQHWRVFGAVHTLISSIHFLLVRTASSLLHSAVVRLELSLSCSLLISSFFCRNASFMASRRRSCKIFMYLTQSRSASIKVMHISH